MFARCFQGLLQRSVMCGCPRKKDAKAFRQAHGSWHAKYVLPRSNRSCEKTLSGTSLSMPSKLFQASLFPQKPRNLRTEESLGLASAFQALAAVEQEASRSSSHASRFQKKRRRTQNARWACPRPRSVELKSWILGASQVRAFACRAGFCFRFEAWCHGSPAGCTGRAPGSSSTTGASEDHGRSVELSPTCFSP